MSPTNKLLTTLLLGPIALALLVQVGCEKREKKKPVNLFSQKVKVDYSQVKVPKPPPPVVVKKKADTWAARTQESIKKIQDDMVRCRTEFMTPFQFAKMRRRDVMWLRQNEMDQVCRDGDGTPKNRGPWRLVSWLAKEQVGKHPLLDRYIALALDQGEHYRIVSLMAKKVGAPEIALITETAQASRDRTITAGIGMDRAARQIAAWAEGELPHDDPSVLAKGLTAAEYAIILDSHYSFFMNDTLDAYNRFAAESWKYPNMIKFKSYRAWHDIPTKHLQQDRVRLENVKLPDDKSREAFVAYLAGVEAVLGAWSASYKRYIDDKSDTWSPKDPHRRPLERAVKAWQKLHAKVIAPSLPAPAAK